MIFFVANDGTIIKNLPSPVYQGAANANTIYLIAPFASGLSASVAFQLPNGIVTDAKPMAPQNSLQGIINKETGEEYSGWSYAIPSEITEYYGTVTAQFYFYTEVDGMITATSATSFQVAKGVPAVLPDEPSADVYELILNNLASLQKQLNNGAFAARAIYAWNSEYTYGANEITFYPIGEFGAFVRSIKTNNTAEPYIDGKINSEYWEQLVSFDDISDAYYQKLKDLADAAAGSAEEAAQSAESAAKSASDLASLANRIVKFVPELPEIGEPDYIYAVVSNQDSNLFDLWAWVDGVKTYLGSANLVTDVDKLYYRTLSVEGWQNNTQTVQIEGLGNTQNVSVYPIDSSAAAWVIAGISVTVNDEYLEFTCTSQPQTAIGIFIEVFYLNELPTLSGYYTKPEIDRLAGNSVTLTIDNETYIITLQLISVDGTVLSTGSIDLPLESVVVGGRYDEGTKSIILTLKNGQTISIPVGDLIDGLASQADLTAEVNARINADKALSDSMVTLTGEQIITGKKTFSEDTDFEKKLIAKGISVKNTGGAVNIDQAGNVAMITALDETSQPYGSITFDHGTISGMDMPCVVSSTPYVEADAEGQRYVRLYSPANKPTPADIGAQPAGDYATVAQVNAKYTKPSTGIPKTDLASAVQTSLNKADSAIQSLPIASPTQLGCVQPVVRSVDMTQDVGVTNQGRLYTYPGKVYMPKIFKSSYGLANIGEVVALDDSQIEPEAQTIKKYDLVFDHSGRIGQFTADYDSTGINIAKTLYISDDYATVAELAAKYTKPDSGIPKSDLSAGVQASLDKADTALQKAPVTSVAGKTGAVILVKQDVGLGNVDNTSDANKPISTAQQAALNLKQNINDTSLTTTAKTVTGAINENKTAIDGIREQITNEAHFRGYFASEADLKAEYPTATPNDYAYVADADQKSYVWIWGSPVANQWNKSDDLVPDQLIPKSTTVPLMNGSAAIGNTNTYADGAHVHPVDTSRASQTALNSEITNRTNADTALGKRIDGEITNRTAADQALETSIDNHISDKSNPHGVTAEQVDALPISGGTLGGSLTVNGAITSSSDININGGKIRFNKPDTTGGWARGVELFASSAGNAIREGAFGYYGAGSVAASLVMMGLSKAGNNSWWSEAACDGGVFIRRNAVNIVPILQENGKRVYSENNKPTPADIGAATEEQAASLETDIKNIKDGPDPVFKATNAVTAEKVANALTLTIDGVEKTYTGEEEVSIEIKTSTSNDPNAVHFTAQTLTAAQQKQARMNIGAASFSDTAISIATTKWSNKTAVLTASDYAAIGNVTTSSHIELFSSDASAADFVNSNIRLTAQAAGSVTISCDTVPTAAVTANILIIN